MQAIYFNKKLRILTEAFCEVGRDFRSVQLFYVRCIQKHSQLLNVLHLFTLHPWPIIQLFRQSQIMFFCVQLRLNSLL